MAGDDKMLELRIIESLIAEVMALIGEVSAVDFQFKNSKKRRQSHSCATILESYSDFLENAQKKSWAD